MTTHRPAPGKKAISVTIVAALLAALLAAAPASARARTSPAATSLREGAGMKANPSVRVRVIQRALRRRGYSLGDPGVDGRFGPLTAAAVRRFQARSGLVVDGIVSAGTRRTLALTVRSTHHETHGRVMQPGGSLSPLVEGVGMGRRPSIGVRRLQLTLTRNGFEVGRPGIDGRFGPLTAAAVRRMQRSYGLVPDGVVGTSTQRLLGLLAGAEHRPSRDSRPATRDRHPNRTSARQTPHAAQPTARRLTPPSVSSAPQHPSVKSRGTDTTLPTAIALVAALIATAALIVALTAARRGDARSRPLSDAPQAHGAGAYARPDENGRSRTGPSTSEPIDGHAARAPVADEQVENGAGRPVQTDVAVIGYATVAAAGNGATGRDLRDQAETIVAECKRSGLVLLQLVREREPRNGKAGERPGLGYALSRIAGRQAEALIVADLSALSPSVPGLGRVLESLLTSGMRVIAVAQGIDTGEPKGLFAVRTLIEVSGWERERLSERTRNGLRAAANGKGRPKVADDPELSALIVRMRTEGMTLQAIADRLNAEGVATVRGGAEWRPSSVQAAAGYHRPRPADQSVAPAESNGTTNHWEE
jgi:peptidoglycan hydrolase-like protein with peptidoglycan-binding domain/DNA invertase Pin-like site-specific DNA recombinase